MRKKLRYLLTLVLIVVMCAGSVTCQAQPKTSGIYVQYRSQSQIRSFVKKHKFSVEKTVRYAKKPSVISGSYKAGSLKQETLTNGLNALNTMRYIAGLPANVKLDGSYNKTCQAAALVNAANDVLTHTPARPSGMASSLYNMGYKGASSSNIAWTSWQTNLAYGVVCQWMDDGDGSNIDRVGHRRWILNPSMKKTGFGYVEGYSAMYAFDNIFEPTKYYGVAWPAQNMPVDYFQNSTPWSISMGNPVNPDKVKVTLTRTRDGKKWVFSEKKSSGFFNVENSYYGQTGCIIFRPNRISYSAGDKFKVKITGLGKPVSYEVNFFKL